MVAKFHAVSLNYCELMIAHGLYVSTPVPRLRCRRFRRPGRTSGPRDGQLLRGSLRHPSDRDGVEGTLTEYRRPPRTRSSASQL